MARRGSRILKRVSKNGYTYYACEKLKECGFMTWDVPVKDNCPSCGQTMFKRAGRGYKKPFCINEKCPNFLPEDKRGYKKTSSSAEQAAADGKSKTTAKKTAASKGRTASKTKKTTGKTAAKKPAK